MSSGFCMQFEFEDIMKWPLFSIAMYTSLARKLPKKKFINLLYECQFYLKFFFNLANLVKNFLMIYQYSFPANFG